MNNITKYNLKTCAISALGLILLLCGLSYVIAPGNDRFDIHSINPLGVVEGSLFALGFGLGLPTWLSAVITGGLLLFIYIVLLWLVRKSIK